MLLPSLPPQFVASAAADAAAAAAAVDVDFLYFVHVAPLMMVLIFLLDRVGRSVFRCSQEVRELVGASREPYRVICKQLEEQLEDTIEMLQVTSGTHAKACLRVVQSACPFRRPLHLACNMACIISLYRTVFVKDFIPLYPISDVEPTHALPIRPLYSTQPYSTHSKGHDRGRA